MSLDDTTYTVEQFVVDGHDDRSRLFRELQGSDAVTPDPVLPGTEVLLLRRDTVPVARASLFLIADLVAAPGVSGLIGHYEARDAASGVALLDEATRRLQRRGARRVLGPMNGSSWMRYRLALPSDTAAGGPRWFAGEPVNVLEYPAHWQAAGFAIAARYESRVETIDGELARSAARAAGTPPNATVQVRQLNTEHFDLELQRLHQLSLDAFADNPYYSPIPPEQFHALYAPFRDRLDPRFVLIAELPSGEAAGFVFAYPDALSVLQGRPTRLVIKTLAVATKARGLRVSSVLLDTVRLAAAQAGFEEVISALMRDDNATQGMAARRSSALWRRYALFERVP